MPGSNDNVTLRDVYDAVNRIEDKLTKRIDNVEEDVNELQSFQNRILGIATVLSVFISGAATFVWQKITKPS